MKKFIRHILKEEVDKKIIAKSILDQLNLSPWKNERYQMEYLVTPAKQIIILNVKGDKEVVIQRGIYNILSRIFNDEQEIENFVFEYNEDNGLNVRIGSWLSNSVDVGMLEDDDEPIILDNI